MTEVKRYSPDDPWTPSLSGMKESPNGEYVRYEDYQELEAKLTNLRFPISVETIEDWRGYLISDAADPKDQWIADANALCDAALAVVRMSDGR